VAKVRKSYMGGLCGMCGDYDGDSSNDWVRGPVCEQTDNLRAPVSHKTKNK